MRFQVHIELPKVALFIDHDRYPAARIRAYLNRRFPLQKLAHHGIYINDGAKAQTLRRENENWITSKPHPPEISVKKILSDTRAVINKNKNTKIIVVIISDNHRFISLHQALRKKKIKTFQVADKSVAAGFRRRNITTIFLPRLPKKPFRHPPRRRKQAAANQPKEITQ